MKTYLAKFNPEVNKGVYGISLVYEPAMEGLFITLSAEQKEAKIEFKTINEEQRIIAGLVLEPDKDIYRNQDGEEFNLRFDADTIKELCYHFTKNQNNSNSTIEHSNKGIQGVTFVENWLVRDEKIDTSVALGFDAKVGSWVSVSKIDDDNVWENYIKTGKVRGFSIDALLSLEEVKLAKNFTVDNTPIWFSGSMITKGIEVTDLKGVTLKDGTYELQTEVYIDIANGVVSDIREVNLKSKITMSEQKESVLFQMYKKMANEIKLFLNSDDTNVKLGSVKSADGTFMISFDGDTAMKDGAIWIEAEDGTKVPVPVGDHPMEGGLVYKVDVEGVLAEIIDTNTPADTSMTDATPNTNNDAQIAEEISTAIKSILIKYSEQSETIKIQGETIVEMQSQIVKLGQEPASKGIIQNQVVVDLSKLNKKERILHALKN